MNRYTIRIIAAVVALAIGGLVAVQRKGNASEQFRTLAHAMVAHVDGYAGARDYYDSLVDQAHDEVFSDAYHDRSTRYSGDRSWVDGDKYLEDLLAAMIRLANQDNAPHVAAALTRYRDEQRAEDAAEPSPPARKPSRPRR
jgi:hypothetical protein